MQEADRQLEASTKRPSDSSTHIRRSPSSAKAKGNTCATIGKVRALAIGVGHSREGAVVA